MKLEDLEVDDIVLAPCYFYDTAKKSYEYNRSRCFVIEEIDEETSKCLLRSISTQKYEFSHKIENYDDTGLDEQPSYIHCCPYNLATYDADGITSKIGKLHEDDADLFTEKVGGYGDYNLKKELLSVKERIQRRRKELENER